MQLSSVLRHCSQPPISVVLTPMRNMLRARVLNPCTHPLCFFFISHRRLPDSASALPALLPVIATTQSICFPKLVRWRTLINKVFNTLGSAGVAARGAAGLPPPHYDWWRACRAAPRLTSPGLPTRKTNRAPINLSARPIRRERAL